MLEFTADQVRIGILLWVVVAEELLKKFDVEWDKLLNPKKKVQKRIRGG
jgi:hypothetical protein